MHGSTILIHFPFLCKKIRFLIFPAQARVLVSKGVKFWVISRPKNLTHFWANKSNSVPHLRVCFFFCKLWVRLEYCASGMALSARPRLEDSGKSSLPYIIIKCIILRANCLGNNNDKP